MLTDAGQLLLDVLVQAYAALLIFRFHLLWLKAPFRNPLGEFIMLLTDPLVLRVRRYVPAVMGLDSATFLLALAVESLYLWATLWLHNSTLDLWLLPVWALIGLFKTSLYLLMGALFIQALLSWTNPHTPFAPVLNSISQPFLRQMHRVIKPTSGIDLSFLFLFLLLQLILMLPGYWLESRLILTAIHPVAP